MKFVFKNGHICNWFRYKALVDAIPQHWKLLLNKGNMIDTYVPKFKLIEQGGKTSRVIYKDLIDTDILFIRSELLWEKKAGIDEDTEDYCNHFKNVYTLTDIISQTKGLSAASTTQ